MFNIGIGELLIVLVVAFVIVGPDDLPKVARWLGMQLRRLRLLIRDIKAETGWNELEKEVRSVQQDVKATVREVDITADLKEAAKSAADEVSGAAKGVKRDLSDADRALKKDIRRADDEIRTAVSASESASGHAKNADSSDE